MRAIAYGGAGGPDVISLVDRPEPALGPDDALVDVAYAGLNRADLLQRAGNYGDPVAIPGLEFSGTVAAIGDRVRAVAPGDRVCGLVPSGAHAARLVTDARALAVLPERLALRDAAAIPEAFLTASDALQRAGFGLGANVLIHAVGSAVGLAAVGLVAAGGGFAIGTSRTPAKGERAKAHGLAVGILLADGWAARVRDATSGRGADIVLDFIGAPALDTNVDALAAGGRIVQIGTLGGATAAFSLGPFMAKRASLYGTVMRTRGIEERIVLARHLQRALLPLFVRGTLRTEIDRVFTLARMREAHEYMQSDENFGKILLSLESERPER